VVDESRTPYALVGGADAVEALVERFYDIMGETEPELARLHEVTSDGDVARGPRDRFALFLIGWLGGPQDYIAQHGHPRLRMRHHPFPVTPDMRDRWLRHMRDAVDSLELDPTHELVLWTYLERAAHSLVNSPG